jgi:uncharacterized protein
MKTSEIDILIVPGWTNSGPDHWQSRWQRQLKTARRVEQADWETPVLGDWAGRIIEEVALSTRPAVIVAHSLGVHAAVHAAHKLPAGMVAGAFLVAAPDLDQTESLPPAVANFAAPELQKLPFPSVLVASSNDPYCSLDRAREFAKAWDSILVEAGDSGHINTASGQGPWPEGLMRFGWFLKHLADLERAKNSQN